MVHITEYNALAWAIVANLERNRIVSAIIGTAFCEPSTVCGRLKKKAMFAEMIDTYNVATHVIREISL